MTFSQVDMAATVDRLLVDYGTELVSLLRYVDGELDPVYGTRAETYDDPVDSSCHVTYGRVEELELRVQLDEGVKYDAVFVFGPALAALLPDVDVNRVLSVKDRLEFDGRSFRVTAVHNTGNLRGGVLVYVAFAALDPGASYMSTPPEPEPEPAP